MPDADTCYQKQGYCRKSSVFQVPNGRNMDEPGEKNGF